ncbi:hypothetical protein [Yinghuangia soli]|uniref:Secreted protein n=1 Tax=Yinghuangia soli TaxID=2908204 RepID=A0AA41TYJ7_9ACTN|nr:hypothetical protein [Yinghuangia soli]MCF2526471.1 hypothetical protein [Yinghuangia soli]
MQRARTARVRTAALGTTVGLCLLIPLAAASADSAHPKSPSADGRPGAATASPTAKPRPSGSHDFGNGVAPGSAEGLDAVKQLLAATGTPAGTAPAAEASKAPAAPASTPVSNSLCGKAVEVPGGIRAQTCVEREGTEVWGRVYYRNPTADPLLLVLGLLKPDGDTVEIRCTIEARAGEGQCETPRLRTDQALPAWSAIAEMATADSSRKVLRSGTASAAG